MRNDYISVNRANWDERAALHAASKDYSVERFLADPEFLSDVVRFDRPRLGELAGLRGVHLQCHIGTDTVSLARLGARMTGLDFSPASLEQARRLAAATGADVDFQLADVYDAVNVLGAARYDLVYVSVGALCWLPSVARWAEVVAALLAPGGRLFIREGHPMLGVLDDEVTPAALRYPYFESESPMVFDDPGTYVETDQSLTNGVTQQWNHGIGEIVPGLLAAGMQLTQLIEHNSVPWEALPGQMRIDQLGEWRLTSDPDRLAASFTLQAVKIYSCTG